MTETVRVALGARAYDIEIGEGLIAEAGTRITPYLHRDRVAIITEERVAGHHLETLLAGLEAAGIEARTLTLPPGESTKDWANLTRTVEWLIAQQIERDDLLIAFGGGVIGDLAGFAAAILRRGVGFVQIPTSLLAQVDSSVGGKTGINSAQGKNLIGAFHQPRLVLADTGLLATMPSRDLAAGYGEVVKYGLLGDATFFEWLEAGGASDLLSGQPDARISAVRRSCEMKAAVVARDEQERGDRALLNLGHTFGHALEAATGYGDRLLHGEGVAIGCVLAFEASARMGLCAQEAPGRVAAHMATLGVRSRLRDIAGELPDADGLLALMQQDKKVQDGRIAFILAHGIGEAFVARDADLGVIRMLLAEELAARG